MSPENPYAVSESLESATLGLSFPELGFCIDDNLIACGRTAVLPEVCVRTGSSEDLAKMKKRIVIVPGWAYLGLIGGLLPLLILYMLTRKDCLVTYALSRRIRNQLRWRFAWGIILLCTCFVPFLVGASVSLPEAGVIVGLIQFVGGLVLLHLGSAPLSIKRQRSGKVFWLQGADNRFLDQFRQSFDSDDKVVFNPMYQSLHSGR